MTCVICKTGRTRAGTTTVTLERDASVVIIRAVPADVCDNCGEYYLSLEITRRVFDVAERASRDGAEVEILRFAA